MTGSGGGIVQHRHMRKIAGRRFCTGMTKHMAAITSHKTSQVRRHHNKGILVAAVLKRSIAACTSSSGSSSSMYSVHSIFHPSRRKRTVGVYSRGNDHCQSAVRFVLFHDHNLPLNVKLNTATMRSHDRRKRSYVFCAPDDSSTSTNSISLSVQTDNERDESNSENGDKLESTNEIVETVQ